MPDYYICIFPFWIINVQCTWIMIYTKAQLDIKKYKILLLLQDQASGHVINVLDMNWLFYHSSFHSKEPWFSLSLSVFREKTLSLLVCPPNSVWWRLPREFSTDVPITFQPNGLQIYFDRSTTSLLFIFIGGKIKASLNGEIWMTKVLQNVWGNSGGWIKKKVESEVKKGQICSVLEKSPFGAKSDFELWAFKVFVSLDQKKSPKEGL